MSGKKKQGEGSGDSYPSYFTGSMKALLEKQTIDLGSLRNTEECFLKASKAENTRRSYRHAWGIFVKWCGCAGVPALPTTPENVRHFIAWSLCGSERAYRFKTVQIMITAIREQHEENDYPSPIDLSVRKSLWGAARQLREKRRCKAALTIEQLRRIALHFVGAEDPIDIRDRSLILLGFACGWRRSEIANLNLSDVRFLKGGIRLFLQRSKTDQRGCGREIGIPEGENVDTCPVRALRRWLEFRGMAEGPLYMRFRRGQADKAYTLSERLGGQGMCTALKRALRAVGENPKDYGMHSLRAGLVTTAAEAGSSHLAIMARTGHTNLRTVMGYVRSTKPEKMDPLSGLL